MAITVTTQTIVDGDTILVVKCQLVSGAAADVTAQQLLDVSTFVGGSAATRVKIMQVHGGGSDFDMELLWDATTDVKIMTLPVGEFFYDFSNIGGLPNNGGTGVTGDIMFTTRGAAADSECSIILFLRKS